VEQDFNREQGGREPSQSAPPLLGPMPRLPWPAWFSSRRPDRLQGREGEDAGVKDVGGGAVRQRRLH
jgi:hypothetical protein